jgi:hypothetical protein
MDPRWEEPTDEEYLERLHREQAALYREQVETDRLNARSDDPRNDPNWSDLDEATKTEIMVDVRMVLDPATEEPCGWCGGWIPKGDTYCSQTCANQDRSAP